MADEPKRPTCRSECVDGPRPCPWVSCRYHLAIDVGKGGAIVLRHGNKSLPFRTSRADEKKWTTMASEYVATLEPSCALDVADEGESTLGVVADAIGISRERVRQVEEMALAKLREGQNER